MRKIIFSIVFTNFNGGNEPIECLKSIRKLNFPKHQLEVIVIDNGSIDSSDLKIRKLFPDVKLIKLASNIGFPKGINLGIKASKGEIIFIGNDDILFERDSLNLALEYLKQNPKTGVLGGKIFFKDHPKKICSAGYEMNFWTGNISVCKYPNQIKEPDWIQGCAMIVPRKTISKIGLLDENFSLIYFEDVDFCLRVKKAGLKVVYLPQITFWHGEAKTLDKNKQNKYYQWYKNKIQFVLKDLPFLNVLSILFIQTILVMPFRALILKDGRFGAFIKGFLWNIK